MKKFISRPEKKDRAPFVSSNISRAVLQKYWSGGIAVGVFCSALAILIAMIA